MATHDIMKVKLSEQVVAKIMPCYQRLAANSLLERCTRKTQNANESVHSVIWNKCPKEIFVSKNKLELAAVKAMAEFNMGCAKTQEVTHALRNISTFSSTEHISEQRDRRPVSQCKRFSSDSRKRSRKSAKRSKLQKEEAAKKSEGPTYGAGQF